MSRCMRAAVIAVLITSMSGEVSAQGDLTGTGIPFTEEVDQVDIYHGIEVADPYRWLEQEIQPDGRIDRWIDRQNQWTSDYLARNAPVAAVREQLVQHWNYERLGTPRIRGDRTFHLHNTGLQEHAVLYMHDDSDPAERALLDPNSGVLGEAGSLGSFFPSPDGQYVALTIFSSGSDWQIGRVISTSSGEFLDDELRGLRFTELIWSPDGEGFYYAAFEGGTDEPTGDMGQNLYFHRLGDSQSEDRVVFSRAETPEWGYTISLTGDQRYLVIQTWVGTEERYEIAVIDFEGPSVQPTLLIEGREFNFTPVGAIGNEIFFLTNNDAPRNRVVAIDPQRPDPIAWRAVIPERDEVLQAAYLSHGRIVGHYLRDVVSEIRLFAVEGRDLGVVELPSLGSVTQVFVEQDGDAFFRFTSLSTPPSLYRLAATSRELQLYRQPSVGFDPEDYVVEQEFFEASDGAMVPVFLGRRRDTVADARTPTLMFGYGGFGVSQRPLFNAPRMAWMDMGGQFVLVNARGGAEYGLEWHEAGKRLQRQRVFDDFIEAAEYLIASERTSAARLGMQGISNGGTSIGAVATQRPDLMAVALLVVPPLDMLRFDQFPGGRLWVEEFGSPANLPDFQNLISWSPYHNVDLETEYPATMIITADSDDRVAPSHGFKFTAAMQAAQQSDSPVLLRVHRQTGHGGGMTTSQVIDEYAEMWALLASELELEVATRN